MQPGAWVLPAHRRLSAPATRGLGSNSWEIARVKFIMERLPAKSISPGPTFRARWCSNGRPRASAPTRALLINAQMSGFGDEAEILCSTRALPVLTPSGRKLDRNPAAQQSPAGAEVCYPFCQRHGRDRAMNRRSLFGGAAAAPFTAHAQQSERMRCIACSGDTNRKQIRCYLPITCHRREVP
jgi:hypothetical protein